MITDKMENDIHSENMVENQFQHIPFSYQQKDIDSCVLTNAIPKSGTYLINRIVECLGYWENTEVQINYDFYYTFPAHGEAGIFECLSSSSLKKLLNGQLVAAHLPYSKDLEKVIEDVSSARRIKHIFLYRDPRDIFVSYTRYVTYSLSYIRTPKSRAKQKFMQQNFSNDEDRLTYIIQEKKDEYSVGKEDTYNIKYDFLKYEPWLHSQYTYAIKFEELYVELLEVKEKGEFGDVFTKLFDYLEIDVSKIDPIKFYNRVYERSFTASGEKNKIAQYKHYFKECHYEMLDNSYFRRILDLVGYEWSGTVKNNFLNFLNKQIYF